MDREKLPFEQMDSEIRSVIEKVNYEMSFLRNKNTQRKLDDAGYLKAFVLLCILRLTVKIFGE